MTANEYQKAALRTASGMNYEHHGMLMNGALGLCGESGEVADLVKKATFQGHELDVAHVAEELGDVAWYLAVSAHAILLLLLPFPMQSAQSFWVQEWSG